VDDDALVRDALRNHLGRLGYRVLVAGDGQDALRQALAARPAVVVLDLRMPGMDGHAVLRQMKERGLDAAVVFASGHAEVDDVIQVLRGGGVDFLRKPWTPTELAAALARGFEVHARRARSPSDAPPPPSLRGSCSDLSKRLVDPLAREVAAIPSVPSVIAELRALVMNPEASIEKVASLVERDQALLARVLRLGRSAQYSGIGKSADAPAIIRRVGLRQIHALVETVWMNTCFQIKDPRYLPYAARVARFALARAVAMRALAGPARADPSAAYLGGLFADVGALFLLSAHAADGVEAPEIALEDVREHHEAAGGRLLAHWGHDGGVVRVAQCHHSGPEGTEMIVLATAIAGELTADRDLTAKESEAEAELVERSATSLGVTDARRRALVERLRAEYSGALEVLG